MSDKVAEQYAAFPYPAVDPEADDLGTLDVMPGHLLEVNHFVFGGDLDFARPLRVLSAGGGTGNAALMMAAQMAALGLAGEVVDLDISAAAQAIARRRAERRGLGNIRFVEGSLLDVAELGPGPFDYINCTGVLHHLADPVAGLRALISVLAPGGGIGVMVYGEYGRTGLYHLQRVMRLLDRDDALPERLAQLRRLAADLPANAWINRNPVLGGDHSELSDAEIVDRYLHPRDRAYTVPQIADWVADAGAELSALVAPARYDPLTYLDDPDLAARAKSLPPLAQAEMAELLAGDMAKHVFYLKRLGESVDAPLPTAADSIPVLRNREPTGLAAKLTPGMGFHHAHGGLNLEFALSALSPAIIGLIDGQRPLSEIHAALTAQYPDLTWPVFLQEFGHLHNALHRHMYQLFLSRKALPRGVVI